MRLIRLIRLVMQDFYSARCVCFRQHHSNCCTIPEHLPFYNGAAVPQVPTFKGMLFIVASESPQHTHTGTSPKQCSNHCATGYRRQSCGNAPAALQGCQRCIKPSPVVHQALTMRHPLAGRQILRHMVHLHTSPCTYANIVLHSHRL